MKRSTRVLMCISLVALVGLFSLPPAALAEDIGFESAIQEANATIGTQGVIHTVAYTPYNLPVAEVEAPGLQYYPAQPVTYKKYRKRFPKRKRQCEECPPGEQGPPGPPGPPGEDGDDGTAGLNPRHFKATRLCHDPDDFPSMEGSAGMTKTCTVDCLGLPNVEILTGCGIDVFPGDGTNNTTPANAENLAITHISPQTNNGCILKARANNSDTGNWIMRGYAICLIQDHPPVTPP